ncbi:hypothetical protein FSB91_02555 [Listeria monocytogenes]|nr:hypothetical protein [Listeria monocytogenes]
MSDKEFTVSKKQLDFITRTAVETAIKEYRNTQKKDEKVDSQRKFKDVKMLLKNYKQLKAYSDDITEEFIAFRDLWESFGLQDRVITPNNGLTEYNAKTVALMQYVDFRLDQFKKLCEQREQSRRWNLIYDLYLTEEPLSFAAAEGKYNLAKSAVYKQVNRACEDLAILFFGIDAVPGFRN